MALKLEQKMAVVDKVAAVAARAVSVVAVDYRGLTVEQLLKLRVEARKTGVHLQVVANTLAIRALKGTQFDCLGPTLTGPTMLAFSEESLGASARLIRDFAKTYEKLKVRSLAVGSQLLGAEHLERVSKLPTKQESISLLLSVLKGPVLQLVKVLSYPQTTLVKTLSVISDKKQCGEI